MSHATLLPPTSNKSTGRSRRFSLIAAGVAVLLASCASPPPPGPTQAPGPAPVTPPVAVPVPVEPAGKISTAASAREYRRDAASHLYELNRHRIFKGKMPPLLQAVGVMQVELDARGNVRRIDWMRAPRHVPAVMAEIERTVRAASPFPAPRRMGGVVYTDTWLWDKSGLFQLDTLTEGQRSQL
jgi:periplasmic protein TonB